MAQLKIKDEQNKERVHELIDEVTSVGRASDNVVKISDEKSSRHHFRVEKQDGKFVVKDLGSTNGTRLNGSRVRSGTALRHGDVLSLGKTTFVFEDPSAVPAAAAVPGSSGGETIALDAVSEPAAQPVTASEPEGPKFVLKMIEGKTPGKVFELGVKALTIGRHNSSTIQIIDDAASNYHAEINREPIGYVLSDLGSTNGTRVRARNKPDFEKIVKTPLAPGMQIRIGKTLLEFENVGQPVEDDQLFGTIALDPEKLERQLAPSRRRMPQAVYVLGLFALLAGTIYAVVLLAPPAKVEEKVVETARPVNLIANGNFDEGTDDGGNPKGFRVERGAPGIKVEVRPDADVSPEPGKGKLGLQIGKAGAKSASTRSLVETFDTFAVDAGKVYEFSGCMRNDGDGLFGLRVTWLQGDARQLVEYPLVLKETQEWKPKSVLLTPPVWAQRARAGVFVQGKDGVARFDSLCFIEKPDAKAQPRPSLKYGGIELCFEGNKGAFAAESQGIRMLEDFSLMLASEGKAESDLAAAMKPQASADAAKVVYSGELYDFALQDAATYEILAQQGSGGVEVRTAVNTIAENGSNPSVCFYVVGQAAQGDVEVARAGGGLERVLSGENKNVAAVQSLLFNAGRTPQLDISFAKPADVELKREGARRRIGVRFKGELRLALAPESMSAKQEMLAAIAALQKSVQEKKWSEVETRAAKLKDGFGSRCEQARDESEKALGRMKEEWKSAADDIDRALRTLSLAPTAEAAGIAAKTVSGYFSAWAGTQKENVLKGSLEQIKAVKDASQNSQAEQRAEKFLKEAKRALDSKDYATAVSYLNALQKDELGKTKAAEEARKLLPDAEKFKARRIELNAVTDRLRNSIENYLRTKDYARAIELIEKDKEFQLNRKELPELEDLIANLRKKIL